MDDDAFSSFLRLASDSAEAGDDSMMKDRINEFLQYPQASEICVRCLEEDIPQYATIFASDQMVSLVLSPNYPKSSNFFSDLCGKILNLLSSQIGRFSADGIERICRLYGTVVMVGWSFSAPLSSFLQNVLSSFPSSDPLAQLLQLTLISSVVSSFVEHYNERQIFRFIKEGIRPISSFCLSIWKSAPTHPEIIDRLFFLTISIFSISHSIKLDSVLPTPFKLDLISDFNLPHSKQLLFTLLSVSAFQRDDQAELSRKIISLMESHSIPCKSILYFGKWIESSTMSKEFVDAAKAYTFFALSEVFDSLQPSEIAMLFEFWSVNKQNMGELTEEIIRQIFSQFDSSLPNALKVTGIEESSNNLFVKSLSHLLFIEESSFPSKLLKHFKELKGSHSDGNKLAFVLRLAFSILRIEFSIKNECKEFLSEFFEFFISDSQTICKSPTLILAVLLILKLSIHISPQPIITAVCNIISEFSLDPLIIDQAISVLSLSIQIETFKNEEFSGWRRDFFEKLIAQPPILLSFPLYFECYSHLVSVGLNEMSTLNGFSQFYIQSMDAHRKSPFILLADINGIICSDIEPYSVCSFLLEAHAEDFVTIIDAASSGQFPTDLLITVFLKMWRKLNSFRPSIVCPKNSIRAIRLLSQMCGLLAPLFQIGRSISLQFPPNESDLKILSDSLDLLAEILKSRFIMFDCFDYYKDNTFLQVIGGFVQLSLAIDVGLVQNPFYSVIFSLCDSHLQIVFRISQSFFCSIHHYLIQAIGFAASAESLTAARQYISFVIDHNSEKLYSPAFFDLIPRLKLLFKAIIISTVNVSNSDPYLASLAVEPLVQMDSSYIDLMSSMVLDVCPASHKQSIRSTFSSPKSKDFLIKAFKKIHELGISLSLLIPPQT